MTCASQVEPVNIPIVNPSSTATSRSMLARWGMGLLALLIATCAFFQINTQTSVNLSSELFRLALAAGLLIVFLCGYREICKTPETPGQRRLIVAFAIGFAFIALLTPPFHSNDIYCYINRGWQQAGYGLNPFMSALADTPNWQTDPMFRPFWTQSRSPYGFLFESISYGLCWLGHGNWLFTLLLFKAVGAAVFGLTGWIVWKGCRRLGLPNPQRSLYLVLWNPLLLMHFVANGHNDVWMGLLAACAIYLVICSRWLAVVPVLIAATLIKYATGALLPLTVFYLAKRFGWRKALLSTALGCCVACLLAWQYAPDNWSELLLMQSSANTSIHNSLAAMAYFPFEISALIFPALHAYADATAKTIALAFWAGFFAFYCPLHWLRLRTATYERSTFLHDCVLIQFVLVCLVCSKYYAWYMGMFFPLALWLPEGSRLRRVVVAMSCAQLMSVTFVGQAHFLNGLVMVVLPLIWALRIRPRQLEYALPSAQTWPHVAA